MKPVTGPSQSLAEITPLEQQQRQDSNHSGGRTSLKPSNSNSSRSSVPNETGTANPAAPAPTYTKLRPMSMRITSAEISRRQVHPFNEIKAQSKTVFNKLRQTETRIADAVSNKIQAIRKNPVQEKQFKEYKKALADSDSQQLTDLSATKPYQGLKGKRENSALERLLDQDSALRHQLYPLTGGFRDRQTGLYAELHLLNQSPLQYVLCIPGTGLADDRSWSWGSTQWATNAKQFLGSGGVPPAYSQALALADELNTLIANDGGSLVIAGHSLGGGIANYVGVKLALESYCFNAAALGEACLKDIEEERTTKSERKQHHIRIKGDKVTSEKTKQLLCSVVFAGSSKSIRAPENVGTLYEATPDDPGFPDGVHANLHMLRNFDELYTAKSPASKAITTTTSTSTSTTTTTTTTAVNSESGKMV